MEDTVSYTYDANGNRATMVSKVNEHIYATTTYSYNLANMVVSMTNDPSNESAQTFTYTYYLDGNQRTKTEGTKVTTYAYDYAGRLVSEVTTDNGTPSVGYTYTYDDFGNRLTMTTDGVTTSYTYDLNNRLLQTTAGETTVTYTYNANGDMITEYKVEANIPKQNTTYTYSIYTGMLTSVSSTVGNVNASYDYNASGLRMKNGDTYFIYDGQNIVAEYDLAEDEYIAVYGCGINRISRFTDGTTGEIYLFNAHGDVVGLVAISGENVGKITKTYDYDAFGNEAFPDPEDENPFRYCGEYYDKGTNRLYLRARDYDSATGRFTSEDPIRDGLNWYAYCENNPVLLTDPSGLDAIICNQTESMNGAQHMSALVQDEDGKWWFFFWGDTVEYLEIPDEYMESSEKFNEYLYSVGTNKKGGERILDGLLFLGGDYDAFVYIEGDFTKSHEYFKGLHEEYQMKEEVLGEGVFNIGYLLIANNCSNRTMEGLYRGVLKDGQTLRRKVEGYFREGTIIMGAVIGGLIGACKEGRRSGLIGAIQGAFITGIAYNYLNNFYPKMAFKRVANIFGEYKF